jgi:hypothetical protein
MKYVVKMGLGVMIYVPSFVKIGSGIQKLIGGLHRHTDHRQDGHRMSLLFFVQNKENKLKSNQNCKYIKNSPPPPPQINFKG